MPPAADLPRFFVPPEDDSAAPPSLLAAGQEVVLPQTESHHAAHVLRLKEGAPVELFDGYGAAATGTIAGIRKGEVRVYLETVRPTAPRPRPEIHLAFAVPKGNRLDWLLEKATELGVASLEPIRFDRSVAGGEDLGNAKRQRWQGHCIAAAKQSGADWLPTIMSPLPLAAFLAKDRAGVRLYGTPLAEAASMARVLTMPTPVDSVYIVVGPEGGLTDAELGLLNASGFSAARLGHTTLRVETAAIALMAAVLALCEKAE
jgi:16S rRNA (uracil1498-N3)-methyltransferase